MSYGKKFYLVFFGFVLFFIFFFESVFAQNRPEVINRLSLLSETDYYDGNGQYLYDGVLAFVRTIENTKHRPGQSYDNHSYKCYAESRFLAERKKNVLPDSVTVKGVRLDDVSLRGIPFYNLTQSKYISGVPALAPSVNWRVYGNSDVPDFVGDSLVSLMKFPDFYYISSFGSSVSLSQDQDWNITVSKWSDEPGFTPERPDRLRAWILGKTADENSSLRNIQPVIKINENVNAPSYSGGVQAKYSTESYKGAKLIEGTGCAVVRTYKYYPINFVDKASGKNKSWLFIMIVEAEVPVEFTN